MGEKGMCLEANRVGSEAAGKLAVKSKQVLTVGKDANRHHRYRKKGGTEMLGTGMTPLELRILESCITGRKRDIMANVRF